MVSRKSCVPYEPPVSLLVGKAPHVHRHFENPSNMHMCHCDIRQAEFSGEYKGKCSVCKSPVYSTDRRTFSAGRYAHAECTEWQRTFFIEKDQDLKPTFVPLPYNSSSGTSSDSADDVQERDSGVADAKGGETKWKFDDEWNGASWQEDTDCQEEQRASTNIPFPHLKQVYEPYYDYFKQRRLPVYRPGQYGALIPVIVDSSGGLHVCDNPSLVMVPQEMEDEEGSVQSFDNGDSADEDDDDEVRL